MSFSSDVKKELCKAPLQKKCCALAESCGVLLYAGSFSLSELRIMTESEDFALRLPKLFKKAFSVSFDALPEDCSAKKLIFRITDQDKLSSVWKALGYDEQQHFALHLNFALLEEDHCRSAFLRGAFLAGGSVTDPGKRYHMEFATSHLQVGRETEALLRDMDFEPKSVLRGGSSVTYFKHSANIEELLTLIGAPSAAMEIMAAKVEKSMRNTVNRRVNCDSANLEKSVAASFSQVEALTRLTESGVIRTLSAELQEVAVARLLQPELSLSELAETFDPPLTKSCINHRMRKLMSLAKEEKTT
ncbi:MAG: DNA-binding protein WhiA [Oscillospiraceae bacterium]|nr:DNA-binding protein WhiA [Oscillospiraceae bacterium]